MRFLRGCAETDCCQLKRYQTIKRGIEAVFGNVVMWRPLVSAAMLAAGPCDSASRQEARRVPESVTGAGSLLSVPANDVSDGAKTVEGIGAEGFCQKNRSLLVLNYRHSDSKFVDKLPSIFYLSANYSSPTTLSNG